MKKISHWFVTLFTIVLIIGANTNKVSATVGETFEENGFNYTILTEEEYTGTVEINGYVTASTDPTDLVIDSTVLHDGITYTVVSIGERAFYNNNLMNVTIPNSVTTIGAAAFGYNKISNVEIPNSVTTIENDAFGRNQLTNVTIPDSVITIGSGAFFENQLISVTIGNNVTSIGAGAFQENQITSLSLGNKVTTIGDYAFYDNQLTSIVLPDSLITIEGCAFMYNQLTSITIPESLVVVRVNAFSYNQLKTIYLPNSRKIYLLNKGNLKYATNGKTGDLPDGIIEFYLQEGNVVAEYEDDNDIVKDYGETFTIKVNANVVYQQLDRFDDSIDEFIGADENATKQSDLNLLYQWYKDGIAIEGETNAIYSELGQMQGTYKYYVTVNDTTLKEIMVTINANVEESENTTTESKEVVNNNLINAENSIPETGDSVSFDSIFLSIIIIGGMMVVIMFVRKKQNN